MQPGGCLRVPSHDLTSTSESISTTASTILARVRAGRTRVRTVGIEAGGANLAYVGRQIGHVRALGPHAELGIFGNLDWRLRWIRGGLVARLFLDAHCHVCSGRFDKLPALTADQLCDTLERLRR